MPSFSKPNPSKITTPTPTTPVPRLQAEDVKKGISLVLGGWAPLLTHCVSAPNEAAEPLPHWFAIEFPGPLRGLLTVRASGDLALLLMKQFDGEGRSRKSETAAFKEFRDIFASRLMAYLWSQYDMWFNTNFPTYSQSPRRDFTPSANWIFFIEDWPLEVSLWFDRDGK